MARIPQPPSLESKFQDLELRIKRRGSWRRIFLASRLHMKQHRVVLESLAPELGS